MKKALFILAALILPLSMMAQETPKQKEIGLTFTDLYSFGLTYKTGTEKSLWRFGTILIDGENYSQKADSSSRYDNTISCNLIVGKEFRKTLGKNLELRVGADLSFRYNRAKLENDDETVNNEDAVNEQTTYRPGMNLVFGFNYVINEHLAIGAEMLPGITYTTGTTTSTYNIYPVGQKKQSRDISTFSYGLSNGSVLLSIVYRL